MGETVGMEFSRYVESPRYSRDGRDGGFVRIVTDWTPRLRFPDWMMVSSVYVNGLKTLICNAASRENARNPLVASPTRMPDASPTVHVPRRCNIRLRGDMCGDFNTSRSPITTSALPRRIGATRRAMSAPAYWLSASVLTMMFAPSCSAASTPATNAADSPR